MIIVFMWVMIAILFSVGIAAIVAWIYDIFGGE